MQAIAEVSDSLLPRDMSYAWNGISYQQAVAGGGAGVFALSLVLIFLILAALYQSWSLPFSVLLVCRLPYVVLSLDCGRADSITTSMHK
jgi:multidrug efflux pump subunit AcrB